MRNKQNEFKLNLGMYFNLCLGKVGQARLEAVKYICVCVFYFYFGCFVFACVLLFCVWVGASVLIQGKCCNFVWISVVTLIENCDKTKRPIVSQIQNKKRHA